MNLYFDIHLAEEYKNNAQKARVLTENWVKNNAYCPRCGHNRVERFENNVPVSDFYCPFCGGKFELKSKCERFGQTVSDGAYGTMIEKIKSKTNPDFFFMTYAGSFSHVNDFFVIPGFFFVPELIIKRRPLSATARRAGWIGCNINLGAVPCDGRIYVIKGGKESGIDSVISQFQKTCFLGEITITARGWLLDIIHCVNKMPENEFTLAQMYRFEKSLSLLHPNNNNIRAKIRQQLQFLRDKGFVEFLGNGNYRKV